MKCLDFYIDKKKPLAARLPSYEPLSMLGRFIIISLVAVGILHLIEFVVGPSEAKDKPAIFYYVVIIIGFNMAAEFQILLDNILEKFLPVPDKIRLRITIQLICGLLMLITTGKLIMLFFDPQLMDQGSRPGIYMGLLTGLLFVQMTASSLTVARFTQKWIDTQEEIAEMKREKLCADYNSLQDQLNPHFLFNNLSVLKSLIIYDQDAAVAFTENFTDVYRYVLKGRDKRLVKLSEEFEFMKAYYGLHKERLGEGLDVKSNIPEEYLEREIAPLTAQLLIENAIKHNITSREMPLKVRVYIEDDNLVISNGINRREASYSTKTGLKNLVKRYGMLTEREIVVQYDDKQFEVKVPLL